MPSNVKHPTLVRAAKLADAAAIAQIHVETWRAAYRGQISDAVLDSQNMERRMKFWLERVAQARGSVFVAENQEVIGFCDLVPSRDKDIDPKAVAEIAAVYVLPRFWRRGAGRELCSRALAEARRQGFNAVSLWVLASNASAQCFYEAMNFRLDGTSKTEQTSDGSSLHEVRFRIEI